MKSIIHYGDSYKYSHSLQYPKNTVSIYSYMESRGGQYDSTVFIGLQYYLEKYLTERVTKIEVDMLAAKAKKHGIPFDYDGWMHIVSNCNGKLPIRIKAVPEGSVITTSLPLLTIESTDPSVPWVAGFIETLLMKVWYPTTIATKSYYVRKMLERYGSSQWAQSAYHNFGDRGSSSTESAAIGGFAHYTQFMGTDNFDSLDMAYDYYNHKDIPAYSVYATEHSTTTSYGREGEEEFVYKQLLENPDKAIMSFVADSYDVYNFTHFCTDPDSRIRKLVESRPNQKLVLRPDSGDPFEVIRRMLNIMKANNLEFSKAGKTSNILFNDFGILWGDGITPTIIEHILGIVVTNGFAAENFVFGSGGDLMQNVSRDTQHFAIKCSSISIKSPIQTKSPEPIATRDIDVFKDPVTAPGKKSKKGKVTTYYNRDTGTYFCDRLEANYNSSCTEVLEEVFLNGKITKSYTLDEIRARSK